MAAITGLTEDFAGGAPGATITTTNTIFNNIDTSVGAVPGTFNADSYTGSLQSMNVTTAAQTSSHRVDHTAAGGWRAFAIRLLGVDSTTTAVANWWSGATKGGDLRVMPDRTLQLRNVSSSQWISPPLALSTWYWVAIRVTPNSPTGHRVKIYQAGSLIAGGDSGDLTSVNAGVTGYDNFRLGHISNSTAQTRFARVRGDDSTEPGSGITPVSANVVYARRDIVELDTTGSDGTMSLTQTSGTTATITGPANGVFTIEPPAGHTDDLVFDLTATAGAVTDTEVITVTPGTGTTSPIGPLVFLDGSWEGIGGPIGSVQEHAYFYGPAPTDGTTVATLAGRTDYFVLDLKRDNGLRDNIKATNPSAVIEGYMRFDAVREPQAAEISGGYRFSNNACWEVTGTYTWEAVDAQEAWFAHNTTSQRIGSTASTDYWLMEPSNTGWRAFLRDSIIALEAYRPGTWDGIFFDNIERSLDKRNTYGMVPVVPGTGVAYTHAEWATATLDLLTWLRSELLAAGIGRVSGNVIEVGGAADPTAVWASAAQQLDVAMEEFAGASWASPGYPSLGSWTAGMTRIEATPAGTAALHVYDSGTNGDVQERRRFSWGSYLLSAKAGDKFRWTHYGNHTEQWWDTFFDTALGAPSGARVNTSGNIWQRTFAGGTVTVNYDTKAVTIT